jgi:hypothetical protein
MKLRRLTIFTALGLALGLGMMIFAGQKAQATTGTWYVNAATGLDTNTCTSPGAACQTINGAIGKAAAGDTINVAVGTYPELVAVNKTLTLRGAQFGVDARASSCTGVPASESVVTGGGKTAFNVTADDVTIDGFTVQGQTDPNQFGAGIVLGAGHAGAQLLNNKIHVNVIGISLANNSGSHQATITRNLICNNNTSGPASGSGIYTDQFNAGGALTNVLIDNNKFTGNADAGIDFSSTTQGSQSNVTISNNEFAANARAMILFDMTSSSITGNNIHNSTSNATADIRLFEGSSNLTISCNRLANGAGRGSRISQGGDGPTNSTTITFSNNNISGYPVAGLEVDTGSYTGTLTATNNWWGSPTGPTIASNPGGTGVTIVAPDNNVSYSPFLTSLAPCAPAGPTDSIGLFDGVNSRFFLRNTNNTGVADITYYYGPGGAGWIPIMGDWDGDGKVTGGLYDGANGRFFLRNSNSNGFADIVFTFGPSGAGWIPIVGDWNNDGIDTVGLYAPNLGRFFLRNSNTTGFADIDFFYGPAGAGWLPITGDWNGDGTTTIGLFDGVNSRFFLRNTNNAGVADITFYYGPGGAGWIPITGDWDGDGLTTVGLYAPGSSVFFLRNSNSNGFADITFQLGSGNSGWKPLAGNWDGQ